jgi:TonB family protein
MISDQSGSAFIKITNSLGMIWILGFFVLSIKLIFGILSLRKFKNGLEEIHDKRILNILKTSERSFKNHHRASIFASRKITSPLALGISKPLIILPHGLYENLKDNEIRGILLHELSHVYHRDHISGILQRLVSALHWWNPIVYALSADLSRAREEVSDNHVLLENDKKEYAECLINLAERTALISRLPVTTCMASPHFPLKDRVKNILSKERSMETQLKKSTVWMIALISVFIVGAIAGHRLTFASAEKAVIEGLHAEDKAEVRLKTDPYPSANPEPSIRMAASPVQQEKTETADKQKTRERKIVKPKLVKKVDPVYPDEAKEAGVEGAVVVGGITDENGKVIDAKILKGAHELLNKAAVAAVKQWEYKPFVINGKPMPVEFTVTLRFNLEEKEEATATSETTTAGANVNVITLPDDVELKLLKKVEPKYPAEARKKLLGGPVLLEAIIDKQGNVLDVKVVEGEHEVLNDAAIEAVKQWKYEPYKKDGKAQKVRYKIELKFHVK